MSMIGNGLGRSAVVKDTPNYAIKNIALFKIGDKYKSYWLHYFLSSKYGQGYIFNCLQGSGQPFISLSALRQFPIPVPDDYNLIKKVVTILSRYDDLIENYQQQIKLLEEAAQRLYKEWFVDLHFPGYEDTKIVDGVPEGWKESIAQSVYDVTIGKTPPRKDNKWFNSSNGMPWVSIADMKNSLFLSKTDETLSKEAVKRFNVKVVPVGTILLSFKLTVGRVSILAREMCTNEAIAHFPISACELREYTYLYLKNFNYDSLGNTSGISKAINSTIVKNMPIILPTKKVLLGFSEIQKPIFGKIANLSSQITLLTEARDRLLPKLMSGEIEV